VEVEGAARGADRAAGLVVVGLRQQDGDARPAGAGAPLGVEAGELLLEARQLPAAREQARDLEADVVAGARVALARVPEPDDEPVDGPRSAAEQPQGLLLGLGRALVPAGGLALGLLADPLGLLLDLLLHRGGALR